MTTLECVGAPFTYRWPNGCVRLAPGCPVSLPDERAARVLTKMPGRVRILAVDQTLLGQIVRWESRMFWGEMRATVLEDLGHGVRVIHPLTEVECTIPKTWLVSPEG
jgi:hypothetical protein